MQVRCIVMLCLCVRLYPIVVIIFRHQDRVDDILREWKSSHWLSTFRLVKIMVLVLYWIHLSACILYLSAAFHDDAGHTWFGLAASAHLLSGDFLSHSFLRRYSTSVYYSYITISTVGEYNLVIYYLILN